MVSAQFSNGSAAMIIPQEYIAQHSGEEFTAKLEPSPYEEGKRWVMRVEKSGGSLAGYLSMVQRPERIREFSSFDAAWNIVSRLGISALTIVNDGGRQV